MIDTLARIAPEVDRLVWGINGQVVPIHGARLVERAKTVGLESLEGIPHFLDFWLANPLPVATAEARLPYAASGAVSTKIRTLETLGLLQENGDGFSPTDSFRLLLLEVQAARSEVANRTLAGHDAAVTEADGLVVKVISATSEDHLVADVHRRLPDPAELMPRFFDHLVTLRYIRQHDHASAWKDAGRRSDDMSVLTALWAGNEIPEVPDATVRGLRDAGLIVGSSLTESGRQLRFDIESETNRRAMASWSVLDESEAERLLELLTPLPATI